jgi:hypothetical protein
VDQTTIIGLVREIGGLAVAGILVVYALKGIDSSREVLSKLALLATSLQATAQHCETANLLREARLSRGNLGTPGETP